jgi:hypothetical protein
MLDKWLPNINDGALEGSASEIPHVSVTLLPAPDRSYQKPLLTSKDSAVYAPIRPSVTAGSIDWHADLEYEYI